MAPLMNGDRRLLGDVLDDRGIEIAEAIVHRERQREEHARQPTDETLRALEALSRVRALTKPQ